MKRKIYLFNQVSKATNYGIGRYIEQIVNLVKNTDMILTIVELYSKNAKEVSVTKERYGNRIAIPFVSTSSSFHTEKADGRYARNVTYLLKEYIPDNEDCLFHLNYMESEHLPIELKKQFKAKILLTVHYTNWSFSLLGDKVRLRKIVNANKEESTESDAEFIRKSVEKDRQIIEQCDRILCIAQHSYNNVREIYHADKSKLVLVYNGLEDGYQKLSPTRIQRLKKQYYIRPDEKIILFAGRLDEVKAVSYLIKSFQLLLQDRDDIRLIIAGDGDYTQLFPTIKESWTKISFTGYIQKKELYHLYQVADMGVICSIHEEFGLVAIEMMMHKLPVIVTDVGGLSEIIEDGVTGLKVPVKTVKRKRQPDTAVLYDRMKWMLEHPDEAKRLGENARKKFLKTYELSVWGEKMLNVYNSIR